MKLVTEVEGKQRTVVLNFIPQSNGRFIMSTDNKGDGSASIVWMKEL